MQSRLPRGLRFAIGLVCVAVGAVLAVRPFTTLTVLVWLVGGAAVWTGVTRWASARATAGLLDDLTALGWIVVGVAVVAWPDLTVRGVALVVGVGMVVAGLAELVGGVRATRDERAASVLRGAASAVLGVVALAWPGITLLVVAVAFGVRTLLFGVSEVVVALRVRDPGERDAPPAHRRARSVRIAGAGIGLVVALVVGAVSVSVHARRPVVDAFYTAPADRPDEPGRLLRAEPFTRGVPEGASAQRILYTTTRADGVPAVASALVHVPDGVDGRLPVVAWAHGTTGVARSCAPSVLDSGLEAGAFFALPEVLAEGWALVSTDYVGLGTEGPHPYLVGDPAARSVLDAVRAARQLSDLDLSDRTVVWGHSQGGGAALWTGQIEGDYAPDVGVAGVAALAPASDLPEFIDAVGDITGGSIFASYVLTGYAAAYPDVRFEDYVVRTAGPTVRELARRCLAEPAVLGAALASITTKMSVFRDGLGSGPLATRLTQNVPRGPFDAPLLIAQGGSDSLIVPEVQAGFVAGLCSAGNDVEHRSYPGRDHVALVRADSPLLPELIDWTGDRFDGRPFTGNCPR